MGEHDGEKCELKKRSSAHTVCACVRERERENTVRVALLFSGASGRRDGRSSLHFSN
jgi:hypothetical protein